MANDSTEFTLWYGPILIGNIVKAFESEWTWYGTLKREISSDQGPLARRLLDFIGFCKEWNERARNRSDPPDAAEFDQFSDLLQSGQWMTKDSSGRANIVAEAPVFFEGGDVTWRVAS